MNSIKIQIFFLIISLFVSCNDDHKQEPNQNKIDSSTVQKMNNNADKQNNSNNPSINFIEPEKLAEFLPVSIPKSEKYPSNSGFQIWNDKKISSASSEYVFKPGGIVFIINDYGTYNNIPEDDLIFIKKYSDQPIENIQKLILPDGFGYQKWDEVTETGLFEALLFNRIIIRIEGIKLPEKYRNLSDFYYLMNIKDLKKEIYK